MQNGSLTKETRKCGADVWTFRWRERDENGKIVLRRITVGTTQQFPDRRAASPQWSPQNRPMMVRAKPANGREPGTQLFYPAASCGGKSIFVRQLRGPHLST